MILISQNLIQNFDSHDHIEKSCYKAFFTLTKDTWFYKKKVGTELTLLALFTVFHFGV